jgi:hypothetical protein
MADNFNLRTFLTENKLTKNAKLLKEARVEGFDENQKAFEVSFINKYGGGDFRILNAETPEQAEEVFTNIFVNNPDQVQSIKSIEPYQVPAPKPQAQSQPGLEGVNYGSIEIDGVDSDDYPDFVDAYVISAEFEDGTPLSEEELEQLTDELYQSGELADMAAETLYEGNKKPIMKETKLTIKERRLVEMVQRALGLEGYGDDNVNKQREKQGLPPAQGPKYSEAVKENEMTPGEYQDKGMPFKEETKLKYNSIEELMKEIEHGTNEAAHKYKMDEMKRVYEVLEAKVGSLEEGEHAEHIDQKAVKQMRKDIAALRKAEEKLRKEFDKKFAGKEKKETPVKEKATEALQEGAFDLRKFLVENKLTVGSRMLNEEATENPTPEEAAKLVANNADKLANSPVIKAVAKKVKENPQAMKELQSIISKFNISVNENAAEVSPQDVYKIAKAFAQQAEKEEEKGINEEGAAGALGFLGFFGGAVLGNIIGSMGDVAYTAQEIIMGAPNPSHMTEVMIGALIGAVVLAVAGAVMDDSN